MISKIQAIYHFETRNWEINTENLLDNHAFLTIGFTDSVSPINLENVKFEYKFKQNGNVLKEVSYPPNETSYVSTDQPIFIIEILDYESQMSYDIYLKLEKDGEIFEKEYNFVTPIPMQPFLSWLWEDNEWVPPIPKPDGNYIWDEDLQEWVAY